jgi:hypothetical protein
MCRIVRALLSDLKWVVFGDLFNRPTKSYCSCHCDCGCLCNIHKRVFADWLYQSDEGLEREEC